MSHYQLKTLRTGKAWVLSVGLALFALILPMALAIPLLPRFFASMGAEPTQLVLGDESWEIPTDLECESSLIDPLGMNCNGTSVTSNTTRATKDPDHAARRMARAYSQSNEATLEEAISYTYGEHRVLIDDTASSVVLTTQGSDEHEGRQLFAVLRTTRPDSLEVLEEIWQAMTKTELPAEVAQHLVAGIEIDTEDELNNPAELLEDLIGGAQYEFAI